MWSSSTKGCIELEHVAELSRSVKAYHEQSPHGVVDEDGSRCDEHAETYKAIGLPIVSVHSLPPEGLQHTIVKFGEGVNECISLEYLVVAITSLSLPPPKSRQAKDPCR
jgi:hypothetical protein